MGQGAVDPIQKKMVENTRSGLPAAGKDRESSLPEAAQAFEAYFISSMLKEMRKTIPQGGFINSGKGQEIYQSLLDEALAKKMSETGGIGLSRILIQKYSADKAKVFPLTDR